LISRLIVEGARPRETAIERSDAPVAKEREISSRSDDVRANLERQR
jgi:hypothetical protein